ncbi:MAG: Smr/MutS family protein [Deltaproteobacteria bacterium]|nr:Smr/MutS family protein [Deltaproteobacteria bacterium]MBW2118261.1 Smr/MutS family protein [Deltaproteobacteria bacterium]MBW2344025.1 Smr/MutS family protein [Deltaproteobacteria bacterium]
MARRKKRKRHSQRQKTQKKETAAFNRAFKGLVSLEKKSEEALKEPEKKIPPEPDGEPDEVRYFLEAMSDVKPLPGSRKTVTRIPNPNMRPAHPVRDDELEGMAHLSDLVSGAAEMDITFSDEYIEGSVHGFSRKLMRKLKKGRFPVQDYVDLHGLTKQDAEMRIRDFLLQSNRLGLRCVLVIHGRGLNSEDHIPVLKERLPIWLSRGPVKKIVLAFSTAMPYDGGTGAIYILLRKAKGGG